MNNVDFNVSAMEASRNGFRQRLGEAETKIKSIRGLHKAMEIGKEFNVGPIIQNVQLNPLVYVNLLKYAKALIPEEDFNSTDDSFEFDSIWYCRGGRE